jgi:hypothetical protein
MKIQVSTLHASKKVILGDGEQQVEITPDDISRWNKTEDNITANKIKINELQIGDFTFEVQSGVFVIKHTQGKDWKFSPEG